MDRQTDSSAFIGLSIGKGSKKARRSSKGKNYRFFPLIYTNCEHLQCNVPPCFNLHMVFEVLVEYQAFDFSKRALHAGTANSKWLKEAMFICQLLTSVKRSKKLTVKYSALFSSFTRKLKKHFTNKMN